MTTTYAHQATPDPEDGTECMRCGVRMVGDKHFDEPGAETPMLPLTPEPVPAPRRARPIPVPVSGELDPVTSTLDEAQRWVRERAEQVGGTKCPACGQHAQVYRRKINGRQADAIIALYRKHGMDWGHVPTIAPRLRGDGGMIALLRYWGLVEESPELRDDGGRAGWWRVTDLGRDFVLNRVTVPKYARIYDSDLLSLEGVQVSIRDALGERFNYEELMAGA